MHLLASRKSGSLQTRAPANADKASLHASNRRAMLPARCGVRGGGCIERGHVLGFGPAALPRLRCLLGRGDEVGQKRCCRARIVPRPVRIITIPAKRNEAPSGFATILRSHAVAIAPSQFRPARHG